MWYFENYKTTFLEDDKTLWRHGHSCLILVVEFKKYAPIFFWLMCWVCYVRPHKMFYYKVSVIFKKAIENVHFFLSSHLNDKQIISQPHTGMSKKLWRDEKRCCSKVVVTSTVYKLYSWIPMLKTSFLLCFKTFTK